MLLLADCPKLQALPPGFSSLYAMEWLDLFGCESLQVTMPPCTAATVLLVF